jgi:hypothetical protein
VLRELWTVRVYDRTPFVFDIESRQSVVADSPLLIHEYHYGGMAFRGCRSWFAADKTETTDFEFRTSEGLGRGAGNHSRPRWVIAQGSISGAPGGLAVMGHPENLRAPEPVRLHDSKPYFAFSSCVLGDIEMKPGVEQARRYRYVVFDGPADSDLLESVWREFSGSQAKPSAAKN